MFFTNSGAEAWEGAIKLVRKYHYTRGNPKRWRIITVTTASTAAPWPRSRPPRREKLIKGFGPLVDGFDQVAFGNLNELRAAITDETAAICIEPIRARAASRRRRRSICASCAGSATSSACCCSSTRSSAAMGRTGKLFAHEWAGITPDVMCVAKGIGGGFPLGAFLATEEAACGMTPGTHGSTYGGNPLAMAVGNAVLDVVLADGFLDRVERTGRQLQGRAGGAGGAPSRRCSRRCAAPGLMLGLKCVQPSGEMVAELRAAGLLTVGAGDNVVRILPPLIIGEAEIDEAIVDPRQGRARSPAAKAVAHG